MVSAVAMLMCVHTGKQEGEEDIDTAPEKPQGKAVTDEAKGRSSTGRPGESGFYTGGPQKHRPGG